MVPPPEEFKASSRSKDMKKELSVNELFAIIGVWCKVRWSHSIQRKDEGKPV